MSDWSALHDHALSLRDSGQLEQALAAANSLVAQAPNDPNAWEVLGTILIELRRHEDAVNAYSAAINCAARLPDERPSTSLGAASPWYNRAAQYARLGRRDEAIVDLSKAVKREPSWADIVPSDERFQSLTADPELQRIVEQGRAVARRAEILARDRALDVAREEAAELFERSKEFTSPDLTEHVQGIAFDVLNAVTAQSPGEQVARRVEHAFARLAEVLANQGAESPEARVIQRTAHRLIGVALLFHLHDLVDRLREGPWWD
jgi:tetratricopeptide (TPR) repeat protein